LESQFCFYEKQGKGNISDAIYEQQRSGFNSGFPKLMLKTARCLSGENLSLKQFNLSAI